MFLGMASFAFAQEATVIFEDDFEWLDPWSEASGVGQTVETDDLEAKATALTSIKTEVDGQEMTCFDYIESKGYKFIYDKDDNKRIYLQRNYLKFGKTGNHGGIILPALENVPENATVTLNFDWSVMRQGSGKIDPVNLYVLVENGSDSKQFDIPECGWEAGHVLEWIPAVVELEGVTVNKDTKITITQTQWDVSTANRWYLDNIKVTAKSEGSAVESIVAEENAPAEYFNLQGVRVANPESGLYIVRKGSKVSKVLVK